MKRRKEREKEKSPASLQAIATLEPLPTLIYCQVWHFMTWGISDQSKSAASDGSPPASCPSPTYSPGQQRETKTLTLCKHCSATAQTLVLINTVLVTSALKKKLTPTQPDPAQQSSVNTQKWSCTSGKINKIIVLAKSRRPNSFESS